MFYKIVIIQNRDVYMKRILITLLVVCTLGLPACNTKAKEEALAQTTEVASELGEISFTLNGYWNLQQEEGVEKTNLSDSQTYDFMATHSETGTNISIIYDDLTKTDGGTLVKIDDYVTAVQESLKTSSKYTYKCSDITSEKLHGKEYMTFSCDVAELDARQHFYIRRIEDTIVIMMITLYGEDTISGILELAK